MKKVININFQGRVIPIEETASDMLQNYTASLRSYFANEEGRDEIINDIENRIAELFSETLKKGSACITDADVNKVITSMGRPEDFDEVDEPSPNRQQKASGESTAAGPTPNYEQAGPTPKKRLFRDEQDKILGGVASGLANYLNLDPAIIRIIFAFLALVGGSGFLVYIILWIVLPSKSLVNNIRKRLYRDTEDRVIAGVAGGLAKYFDINPAIPRIIFAAPFIFGIITSVGRHIFDPGFVIIGGSGGGTFILAYIILWLVLPEALTTSEKLEMKGEKVDLNSIRNTVMTDMQGFKGRAEKMGNDIKAGAERLSGEAKEAWDSKGKPFVAETSQVVRRGGLGNAIAILVKAFIFFIGGIIALALFVALIVLLGSGVGVWPLKDFLLENSTQQFLAGGTILLFFGVPIIAFIVWMIRRFMRVKSGNKYIGLSFGALWTLGWVFISFFGASLSRSFSSQVGKREDITLTQPADAKLLVKIADTYVSHYDGWFEMDGVVSADNDSLYLNTVRVNVVKSKDSLYHVHAIKISRGKSRSDAEERTNKINFPIEIKDNIVFLPESFTVSKNDKWRNQRVLLVIEVPEGKQIRMDERVNQYDYFNVEFGRQRNWRIDWDRSWENGEYWEDNKDMRMGPDGLEWDTNKRRNDNGNWDDNNNAPAAPALPADSAKSGVPAPPVPPMADTSKIQKPYRYTQENTNKADEDSAEPEAEISQPSNKLLSLPGAKILAHPLSIFRL